MQISELQKEAARLEDWAAEGESVVVGQASRLLRKASRALEMALEIHDEYMSQIGHCVSQDYARLNEFPIRCAELGIRLGESGQKSR